MNKTGYAFILVLLVTISCNTNNRYKNIQKPRLLVITDIGGDPDDTQSLIRLLVTSDQFEIEGIVASASGTPGELDTPVVRTDLVFELIDAYSRDYPNLSLHGSFPAPGKLYDVVKEGNPFRGLPNIGEGMETEGSEWIKNQIEKEDKRPLNIAIWGGQTDLVQALWRLKEEKSSTDFDEITSGIRIYDIDDQDQLYNKIKDLFPNLFYILAKAPPGSDKRNGAFRGMYLGGDESLTSRDWITTNIKLDHGHLGKLYPIKTWTAPNPYGGMKEGDTPSWFYFLKNGLQDPENPEYGGWGGRFRQDFNNYYIDDKDWVDTVKSARAAVWRWRQVYQNDFQARMDWAVLPFDKVNHHPCATINGSISNEILHFNLNEGDHLRFDASASNDPDNDDLHFSWWGYMEPSDLNKSDKCLISNETCVDLNYRKDLKGKFLHLILEVSDTGFPVLTDYRRIIVHFN